MDIYEDAAAGRERVDYAALEVLPRSHARRTVGSKGMHIELYYIILYGYMDICICIYIYIYVSGFTTPSLRCSTEITRAAL